MATNSQSSTNVFIGGMDTDTSYDRINNLQYVYCLNLRILTNLCAAKFGLANGKLAILSPISYGDDIRISGDAIPVDATVLAFGSINNIGCVIVNNDNSWILYRINKVDGGVEFTKIFQSHKYEQLLPSSFDIVMLEETDSILSVYISTSIDQLIVINLLDSDYYKNKNVLSLYVNGYYPSAQIHIDGFVSGSLKTSQVLYSYRFCKKGGVVSKMSPPTKKIQIINQSRAKEQGNQADSATDVGVKMFIPVQQLNKLNKSNAFDNIEDVFDYVLVFRIQYINEGQLPNVDMISQQRVSSSSMSVVDNGELSLMLMTFSEYLSMQSLLIIPKTIQSNQGIMFLGNCNDISTLSVDDINSSTYRYNVAGNKFNSAWDINNLITTDLAYTNSKFGPPLLGGSGDIVSWNIIEAEVLAEAALNQTGKFDGKIYNYVGSSTGDAATKKWTERTISDYFEDSNITIDVPAYNNPMTSSVLRSLMRDEVYRYGIIYYDKYGNRSDVLYISDIRTPGRNLSDIISNKTVSLTTDTKVVLDTELLLITTFSSTWSSDPRAVNPHVRIHVANNGDVSALAQINAYIGGSKLDQYLDKSVKICERSININGVPTSVGELEEKFDIHVFITDGNNRLYLDTPFIVTNTHTITVTLTCTGIVYDDFRNVFGLASSTKELDDGVEYIYDVKMEFAVEPNDSAVYKIIDIECKHTILENEDGTWSHKCSASNKSDVDLNSLYIKDGLYFLLSLLKDDINGLGTTTLFYKGVNYTPGITITAGNRLMLDSYYYSGDNGANIRIKIAPTISFNSTVDKEYIETLLFTDDNLKKYNIQHGNDYLFVQNIQIVCYCVNKETVINTTVVNSEELISRPIGIHFDVSVPKESGIASFLIVRCEKTNAYSSTLMLCVMSVPLNQKVDDRTSPYYPSGVLNNHPGHVEYRNKLYGGGSEIVCLFSPEITLYPNSSYQKLYDATTFAESVSDYISVDKDTPGKLGALSTTHDIDKKLASGYVFKYAIRQTSQHLTHTANIKYMAVASAPNFDDGYGSVQFSGSAIVSAVKRYKSLSSTVGTIDFCNWVSNGTYDLLLYKESENSGGDMIFSYKNGDSHYKGSPYAVGAGSLCIVCQFYDNKLIGDSNDGSKYNVARIVNIKHKATQFAGTTDQEKLYDIYYGFGNYCNLKQDGDMMVGSIDVFDGEIYPIMAEIPTMFKVYDFNSLDSLHSTLIINYVPLETQINLYFDYGMNYRNTKSNNITFEPSSIVGVTRQTRPYSLYNKIYSDNKTSAFLYNAKSDEVGVQNNFRCRIHYSAPKTNGEVVNSWSQYKANDFIDANSKFGPITGMCESNNDIFLWQQSAFGKVAVNLKSLITDSSSQVIQLGSGGVILRVDYISDTIGLPDGDNTYYAGANKVIWANRESRKLYLYSGSVIDIGDTFKIQLYLDKNLNDVNNIYHDAQNGEYCINMNDRQLALTEKDLQPLSVYTRDIDCCIGLGGIIYSLYIKGNSCTKINYIESYDRLLSPTVLSFVVNEKPGITKVFDSQSISVEKYNYDQLYAQNFMLDKSIIFLSNLGESAYQRDSDVITDREGNIKYSIPRIDNSEYGNRLRGKWMKVDMYNYAPSEDYLIYEVSTLYRISL